MNIFVPEFKPPQILAADQFVLFPTDTNYYKSDYEAVMQSRDYLRIWSQSPWPEDDFTAQQNRDDLQHHVDDNMSHAAYGYIIYSPDRTICYGSLYLNPLAHVPDNYTVTDEERHVILNHHARVDCWIAPQIEAEFERKILEAIQTWLKSEWKIRALFSARIGLDRRQDLYRDMGLQRVADLKSKTSNMTLLLFN